MAQQISLDRLKIASPCPADWEAMTGNDQVRFCDRCQLNVYNISAMTRAQAEELIAKTEGRLCARVYRRADGTVITRDCPVGLKALKRKVSFVATTALSAIFSLFNNQTIVWADDGHEYFKHYSFKISQQKKSPIAPILSGTVIAQHGAVIPNAEITLVNEKTKREYRVISTSDGTYWVPELEEGSYRIAIFSPGFQIFRKQDLKINNDTTLQLDVTLIVGMLGGTEVIPEKKIETIEISFPLKPLN